MARNFDSRNTTLPIKFRAINRMLFNGLAYEENNGLGEAMMKDTNFVELIHYGLIDHQNNSIIPNEDFIVETTSGRVFDFVADSYSLMRLNWTTAVQRNLVSLEGSAFGKLDMVDSYKSPKVRYGEYLGNILRFYNETHIPNNIGITNITSYDKYVKNFFNFIFRENADVPITMTRWNTSRYSRILDTGLAFSYADIPYDHDQRKIDEIIDHQSFLYFKNLSLNMGFSIINNNPNILLCDVASPAGASIRESYGIYNLSTLFNSRFIKTYTIDIDILFNIINLYYNKYVFKNPLIKKVKVMWNGVCNKTVSEIYELQTILQTNRPYSDSEELSLYCRIRNLEEGSPFSEQKVKSIYRKSSFFLKTVDKDKAMSYINSEFRDQVWNKDHGYHDLRKKLAGKTTTQAQRGQVGAVPSGRGSSSSY